jgi:hypothetical protein
MYLWEKVIKGCKRQPRCFCVIAEAIQQLMVAAQEQEKRPPDVSEMVLS